MITTLKYLNKVSALALLLTILLNITVPDILPSLRAQAKPELVENPNCVIYPIAFSSLSFKDLKAGSNLEINGAEQPGSFSWLTWTGNPNANLLAASLTPPGNSGTYINPDNPQDTVISSGDWVIGVPGVVNSSAVGKALSQLNSTSIVVPLFDSTRGEGSNKAYKVSGFARVKLLNYEFPKGNRITLQYLGNACETVSLKVNKTVDAASVAPEFSASLSVDKEFAIPGDTLIYTSTITESVSDLTVSGTFSVSNSGDTSARIAYFYDLIDFKMAATGVWTNFAGAVSGSADYTPASPAPLSTGMTFTIEPVPAVGVTYPQGNSVAGTVLAAGSTAAWKYSAAVSAPADQLLSLLDASTVSQLRNSVHFEVTNDASPGALTYNAEVDFTKFIQSQVRASTAVTITLTLPDGSTVSPPVSAFTTGSPTTAHTPYVIPTLSGKAGDETEDAYLDRLHLADGRILKATLDVNTPTGPLPQSVANTSLRLPIVTLDKSGPESVEPGQTVSYNLNLSNQGSAPANSLLVMDLLEFGNSFGTISGVPDTLQPGNSAAAQATYDLPIPQTLDYRYPTMLTDDASVNWLDANGNLYGQVTDTFSSQVVSPYSSMVLHLSPASAGPNLTGSQQTLTATLLDQQQNPVSGVAVHFVIEGTNATTVSQVTGSDGAAVMNYTGTNFGYDHAKAYVITGLVPLESNASIIHWISPNFRVTTSVIRGRFFTGSSNGSFGITPDTTPAFEQYFPNLNFNPVDRPIFGMMPEVGPATNPITDVPVDLNGYTAGNLPVHFADYPVTGGYYRFSAVFTGNFLVTTAGDFTFKFRSDDGFIFGVGNGAQRVPGGEWINPPASEATPFENFPVMGAHNVGVNAYYQSNVIVRFPAPGVYPFEIDYTENGGMSRALTMANNQTGLVITPSTALTINPFSGATNGVRALSERFGTPKVFTATLLDASGEPMVGVPVTFRVRGLNAQEFATVTDHDGKATFAYTSSGSGTDYVQAIAAVDGKIIAVSAEPKLNWIAP